MEGPQAVTRKAELQQRARSLVLTINEIQPEQWDRTDQRDCDLIAAALEQVEREVWGKIIATLWHKFKQQECQDTPARVE
jgi:hypothetical protein